MSEIWIFHLEISQYNIRVNVITKITPNLNMQEQMSQEKIWSLKLHGIIYHEGRHAKSGHYTSSITSDEKLYTVNVLLVTAEKRANLRCSCNNVKVPYILLNKKESNLLNTFRYLNNYMNHICEDDNKSIMFSPQKVMGRSHISLESV